MPMQRLADRGVLAGVCAGLAEHLGVRVLGVRVALGLATLAGGIGAVAYVMLWVLVPAAPGSRRRHRNPWPLIAAGIVALGVLTAVAGFHRMLPLLTLGVAAAGAALVWWRPEEAEERRTRALLRLGLGIGLLALAAVTFIGGLVGLSALTMTVGVVVVVLGGAALVASPFVVHLVRDRDRERAERIEVRQRAEIAAHLHDSVLQTLALIQRDHADPDEVLRLARAEERGLRDWLYGRSRSAGEAVGLAERLQSAAAEVERSEAAVVEVVTVGDCDLQSPAIQALVAAAREAMLNAARHAQDPRPVQVFARIDPAEVQVFVRDRGIGFDPGALPADRGGVRDSVVGRMAAAGGEATIRSTPGAGTDVQLRMPL